MMHIEQGKLLVWFENWCQKPVFQFDGQRYTLKTEKENNGKKY